ncbi:TetR/AcrR family transcriptional regulator [Aeromicrobium stalagmiti]|uniref:TetR/AcrR family transcriptional regulator n=1 Tax=Aeromicrobium stalagmiti TaxID=2738988 RepID=UPI0015693A3C|nr:TetR/AcrR family transcriptional regulator [Aeromicrobium stalagmiti]NRQ49886.1 TetR family transcriptional regulator [Aeromicrobium stalagmiti]
MTDLDRVTVRERIVEAAFTLFRERGYDRTSVDDIAAATGVSRSTFFRHFGSKESVIFPDHDLLLERIEQRLAATTEKSALRAVADAVRLVLFHYVAEGDRAHQRYELTSTVTALRERELVSGARYQHLFRRHLSAWSDGSNAAELRAEVMAAAVVAAHNQVLRRWLRGESRDPHVEIDAALGGVLEAFAERSLEPPAVVVLSEGTSLESVGQAIQAMIDRGDGRATSAG